MMTLDEAIKNHIVQSERALHDIEYYTTQNDMEWLDDCKKEYEQFAEEERQHAEWLKKLKAYEDGIEIIKEQMNDFKCCDMWDTTNGMAFALELLGVDEEVGGDSE